MKTGDYAVVRENNKDQYHFYKIHDLWETAEEEAARLCKKEGVPFIVLKAVNRCQLDSRHVVWEQ